MWIKPVFFEYFLQLNELGYSKKGPFQIPHLNFPLTDKKNKQRACLSILDKKWSY